jgi:flavin-dependent dehydrogenase
MRTPPTTTTTGRHRYAVAVVGARAAGAATALLLARLGHDVLLLDAAFLPSDTISTHQLARPGVVQLDRWDLLRDVLASGAPAIRDVSFTADGDTVHRTVKESAGVDLLVAPRRYVLDTILVEAAVAAGAVLSSGVRVTGVRRDSAGRVAGVHAVDRAGELVSVAARFVVGADGLSSRVAGSVAAPVVERRPDGGAVQYAYYAGVPWHGIELVAADRSLVGVFPTHDDEACVWVATPTADAREARRRTGFRNEAFAEQLALAAPELADRLRAGRKVSPVTGMLRMPNQLRHAYGPGWALVGDAGYHRDAITGHGMSDAYRDAELLAVALDRVLCGEAGERSALAGYQDQRDRALRDVFEITVAMSAYPPVQEFIELQKQLGRAMDAEATELAGWPVPGEPPASRQQSA